MKKILLIVLASIPLHFLKAQSLDGAWESSSLNDQGTQVMHVITFSGNYFSEAIHEKESGKFMGTIGGSFTTDNEILTYTFEFSSTTPDVVGTAISVPYEFISGKLHIDNNVWTRTDDGSPGDLAGAWLISGRKQGGEIVKRDTSGPRKTMKILSGTRFQWIAFNTETKQFMGTGGGTYTTVDGKYTENIGFFSRDDSRVGASLQFNYELMDGDWHHSGLSSKGDPIYEVWSKRIP